MRDNLTTVPVHRLHELLSKGSLPTQEGTGLFVADFEVAIQIHSISEHM